MLDIPADATYLSARPRRGGGENPRRRAEVHGRQTERRSPVHPVGSQGEEERDA